MYFNETDASLRAGEPLVGIVEPMKATRRKLATAGADGAGQLDLFMGELLTTSANKDDIGSMEHPVFSIKKGGDRVIRRYEYRDKYVEITPSAKGSASIWDKDILIYLLSLMRQRLNQGDGIPDRFEVSPGDLLRAIQRGDSGKDYKEMMDGLERLKGTLIKTNISTGMELPNEELEASVFSLLPNYHIMRDKKSKRLARLIIEPSPWFVRQVVGEHLLTIDQRYFSLKSGIKRRIYELSRKHCGSQAQWQIGLDALRAKIGVTRELRKFKSDFKEEIREDGGVMRAIDYFVSLGSRDIVHVFSDTPAGKAALARHLKDVRDTTEAIGKE